MPCIATMDLAGYHAAVRTRRTPGNSVGLDHDPLRLSVHRIDDNSRRRYRPK
jgi:hypothetical protein